jgi:eukaryotic-like serine/threonine-protein kinase
MSPGRQSAEDLLGTVLEGAYRIEGLVGEGGMGAVYEATHLRLGTRVAVKVMARELAADSEALARFHREALVTSGLGHPHIVKVLDFSTTPTGEPFLAMEFLEGEDLERRLRRVGRLPIADVVHIIKQVASALAATHAKTIVHRDLKPGNIYLLTAAGETDFVKVLDFGISKVRSASTNLTRTSSVMGTPHYMSPEQAKGHVEDIDERTDQWALAVIAWECLAGQSPFVGENVPSILFQIVHESPSALVPKVAGLPAQVEDVLLRALAKNKSDRFASVSDFALALERASDVAMATLVGRPQILARPAQSPDATPSRPTTFTQSTGEIDSALAVPRTWPKWILATGAALVLLLAAFLLFRPGPAPKPVVASPAPVAPAPPVPVAPAPLPQTEPPAAVAPSVPETKPEPPAAAPEPKAKTSHSPDGVRRKKQRPAKEPSEENQDIWRVE